MRYIHLIARRVVPGDMSLLVPEEGGGDDEDVEKPKSGLKS